VPTPGFDRYAIPAFRVIQKEAAQTSGGMNFLRFVLLAPQQTVNHIVRIGVVARDAH